MYQIRLLETAIEDLTALDRPVARRIIKRLDWLAENIENTHIETLTGNLTGFCKFRIGNYRVLYEIFVEEKAIVIHQIGHRRDIYKDA